MLLDACRRWFASLFTDRTIHHRIDRGFEHFKVALPTVIKKMLSQFRHSKKAALGGFLGCCNCLIFC